MNEHWSAYKDADAAASACADHILISLESALATQDFATFAVSGGSTPKLLFRHLVERRFDWSRVHLFWADERAVPLEDGNSNYGLTQEFFLKPAKYPSRNIHRIAGELAPATAARLYVTEIRELFKLEENQLPYFDVIQLGMGSDAHTASLFPGDRLLADREGIAAPVVSPKPPPNRVTLLPGVLLSARATVFLVAGGDKAETVREVMEEPLDGLRRPAQLIHRQARRVRWFLDAECSSKLVWHAQQ